MELDDATSDLLALDALVDEIESVETLRSSGERGASFVLASVSRDRLERSLDRMAAAGLVVVLREQPESSADPPGEGQRMWYRITRRGIDLWRQPVQSLNQSMGKWGDPALCPTGPAR